MLDERAYHEYANWKMEHHEILKYLRDENSNLIMRFKYVLDVTDHLYDKLIDDENYTEDEDNIFETGFYYAFDQLDQILNLLEHYGKIEELEKRANDVNLLLQTVDFQNELLSVEEYEIDDLNKLVEFEENLLGLIENKKEVPHDMYEELDNISYEIFNKLDVDYYSMDDIFFEIADELGLLTM